MLLLHVPGGVVGLFTGMSVLSLMELLFWLCRGAAATTAMGEKCCSPCCLPCSKEGGGGQEEEGGASQPETEAA